MQNDYELIDVLNRLKTEDIKLVNPAILTFDTRDIAGPRFNNNLYFVVLKLLNEILTTHYNNEQNNELANKELLKFTYLSKIHLTRLLFNATINPEHINYSCFELGIFYLVLVNLAKSYQFHDLAKALTQIQNQLFQNNAQPPLVITNLSSFQSWYQDEISLYQQQFSLYFNHTSAGKVTFVTEISCDITSHYSHKIIDTYKNPKYDVYQKQLGFKLIEYLYLDSIFVEFSTRKCIAQLMEYLYSAASEDDKQKKLEFTINEYKSILLKELKKRALNNSRETILDLSQCDYHNLIFDLVTFNKVSFANFDKHTKLPHEFRFCIFKNVKFINRQMFENTSFSNCIFIDCSFIDLTISCEFTTCIFENCNISNFHNRFANLGKCKFLSCLFNKFILYRVTAVDILVRNSFLINSSIIFSNLKNSIFDTTSFIGVEFDGTQFNIISTFIDCEIRKSSTNNKLETTLTGALFMSNMGDREFVSDDIGDFFPGLHRDFYRHLIITTELLGCQLYQITQEEFLNNKAIPVNTKFNILFGWILCAVDRLEEYCEDFENNSAIRKFDTFAVFEIVAVHIKTAITHLNRFLSLYNHCHLSLMKQLLKNSLFKNFQQYQQKTNFSAVLYPQVEREHHKEVLFAIHELHQSIKYIDKTFDLIRSKIEEKNNHLIDMQIRKKK